jgi:hypothetical protein
MKLTLDISDTLYRQLQRIAAQHNIETEEMLSRNLADLYDREWKKRYIPNVTKSRMMEILDKAAENREPDEYDKF